MRKDRVIKLQEQGQCLQLRYSALCLRWQRISVVPRPQNICHLERPPGLLEASIPEVSSVSTQDTVNENTINYSYYVPKKRTLKSYGQSNPLPVSSSVRASQNTSDGEK